MSVPIDVVGAVIVRDGLVLCAQRGPGVGQAGLWEFPGGKVEDGETHEVALAREIAEELGCAIEVGEPITTATHHSESASIALHTYSCRIIGGEPVAREHAQIAWVSPDDLVSLDWAPADLPTVAAIPTHRLT